MKYIKYVSLAAALILLLTLAACAANPTASNVSPSPSPSAGQIYLYGEKHGVKKILDKEFELWEGVYHDKNMRHLFIEYPCFTAEF